MRVLLLQIPVLLVASQDIVPLILGPEFQPAYSDKDIFRGFKQNVAEGENPLKNYVFDGNFSTLPFPLTYTKSAVITSVDDVQDMMGIQGSVSVSYGPMISGSGAGRYLNNKMKSKRQISVLYQTRRVAFAKSVDVKTIKAVDGLEKLSADEIAETYGSKFIDQILYGAQLDVIFTIRSSEDSDFLEIEAELEGKIGIGILSVEFQGKFEKQEGEIRSRYAMEIEARASGIPFNVPSNPSFEQVNEMISSFNTKYDEMLDAVGGGKTVDDGNVVNQFSPVGFALSPIARYLPSKLSIEESARFDNKMEGLRDVFYHALFAKSQINNVRAEQELLYGNDPRVRSEIFQPYDSVVDNIIGELDSKIDECLDYRKKPVREILETRAKVPDKYASTTAEQDVLKGLVGEAYIPSPVTISGVAFEDFHYIGFALPSDSPDSETIVPWMGGVLRHDSNNTIFASAYTPKDLSALGLAQISSKTMHEYMNYGDQIFLQGSGLDYRWLKREISSGNAVSEDYNADSAGADRVQVLQDYHWNVRSQARNVAESDPKQGQCVKYGDILFLNANGAWLHRGGPAGDTKGCYEGSNMCARGGCRANTVEKDFETARLQWRVRSTLGTGSLDIETNPDPAHGQCIQLLSKIYLQSINEKNWWLSGGRSAGNEYVCALNFFTTEGPYEGYEQQNHVSYEWIVRKEVGSGLRNDDFFCPATTAKGQWKQIQPVEDLKYEIGIDRTIEFPYWENNVSWKQSVTTSVTNGFEFGINGIGVSWLDARGMESSVHSVLHDTRLHSADDATSSGQVWQFVYEISDACAPKWELKTKDLAVTPSADQEPCCLPGQELHAHQPHGPCNFMSPCQCEESLCHPTSAPTPAPSSDPSAAWDPVSPPPTKDRNVNEGDTASVPLAEDDNDNEDQDSRSEKKIAANALLGVAVALVAVIAIA